MYPFKARLNLLWDLFLSVQVIVCFTCAYFLSLYLSLYFDDDFQRRYYMGVILERINILCFLFSLSVSTCFIVNRICYKGRQNKDLLLKSAKITSAISLFAIFSIFVLFALLASAFGGLGSVFLIALVGNVTWFFCLFLIAVVFDKFIHGKGTLKRNIVIFLIAFYAWLAIDFVFVQQLFMGVFSTIFHNLIVLAMVFLLTLVADFFIYKIQQLRQ